MGSSQVSQKWPSASCHSVAPEAPTTHSELGEQADSWAAERRENFSACCRHRCTQTPAFKLIPPLGLEQRWSHWPPVSFGDALQHFSECSRRRNADNFLETAQWSEQPEHPSPSQQCRGLQLLQFYFSSSNAMTIWNPALPAPAPLQQPVLWVPDRRSGRRLLLLDNRFISARGDALIQLLWS